MSKIICDILIFIALVAFFLSIFALYTFANMAEYGNPPIAPFTDCSLGCIKTTGIISFIIFIFSLGFAIFCLLKNKNSGNGT